MNGSALSREDSQRRPKSWVPAALLWVLLWVSLEALNPRSLLAAELAVQVLELDTQSAAITFQSTGSVSLGSELSLFTSDGEQVLHARVVSGVFLTPIVRPGRVIISVQQFRGAGFTELQIRFASGVTTQAVRQPGAVRVMAVLSEVDQVAESQSFRPSGRNGESDAPGLLQRILLGQLHQRGTVVGDWLRALGAMADLLTIGSPIAANPEFVVRSSNANDGGMGPMTTDNESADGRR